MKWKWNYSENPASSSPQIKMIYDKREGVLFCPIAEGDAQYFVDFYFYGTEELDHKFY